MRASGGFVRGRCARGCGVVPDASLRAWLPARDVVCCCYRSPDKFSNLVKAALAEHTDGKPMTYADFNRLLLEHLFVDAGDVVNWGVRRPCYAAMPRLLELTAGCLPCLPPQHHLERVLKYLQQERDPDRVGLDARVLLVAMSLGLKAKAPDRVAPLFTIFSKDGETMTVSDFITCVGTRHCRAFARCSRRERYAVPGC